MGIYKLLLPKMGESVSEATMTKWLKTVGEPVQEDEAVVEIATDKVDSDVPSPVQGVLKEILFHEGQVVQVGEAIALIEIEGEGEELVAVAERQEAPSTEELEEGKDVVQELDIPGVQEL